jgi:ABC-type transporter Mla MlaB component
MAANPVRLGEHACSRLGHAEDRRRLAAAFVADGVARGHKVIVVRDGDDRGGVIAELVATDDTVAGALETGQLEERAAADTCAPDGTFDVDRMLACIRSRHAEALAAGYRALSLTGEMSWALCATAPPGHLTTYERRVEDEIERDSIVLLCQYDQSRFGHDVLSDACLPHQVEVSAELAPLAERGRMAAARTNDRTTLRLTGELDYEGAEVLAEVLAAHFHGPLRVDLADLDYADVTGMRALRGPTRQLLVIDGASAAVQRLLALMAWDTDPGVEVVTAA